MRFTLAFTAVLSGCICGLFADDSDDDQPHFMHNDSNALGYADYQGCASVWLDFDGLNFNTDDNGGQNSLDEDTLQLRVHFSSALDASSPYFGHGWQCPLVESCVTMRDDGPAVVLLPTGRTLEMQRRDDPANPQAFQTADGAWHATQMGNAFTLVNDEDQWTLRFTGGHIRELKVENAAPVEWIYKGNYVSEIRTQGSTGKAPFSVSFGKNGRPEGFSLNGALHRFKLGRVGLFADDRGPAGQFAAAGRGLTLTDWISGGDSDNEDETDYLFAYSMDEEGHPRLALNNPAGGNDTMSITWNAANRHILTGDEWRYTVSPAAQAGDPPVISRVNDKGQYEYIAIDRARGVVTSHLPDGDDGGEADTITKFDRMNGVVRDEAWQVLRAGQDGLFHKITQIDYRPGERPVEELREINWGENGDVTVNFIEPDESGDDDGGSGESSATPTPPPKPTPGPVSAPTADVFEATERSMLADVEPAAGDSQRNAAIEDLARYYVRTGHVEKALALTAKTADRGLQFEIRELINASDPKTSAAQKVETLRKLRDDFPEQGGFIDKVLENYGGGQQGDH